MAYNYKSADDLVKWAIEQQKGKTKYRLGGIGRYENGIRIFDCVGLIKCFLWRDYSQYDARYYGSTCPDIGANKMFELASVKGTIDTIPEIKGLLVWQDGHIGIYVGNGVVVEATISFESKVVLSHFKGNHKYNKRTTWTHWCKCPYLNYTESKSIDQLAQEVIDGKWGNGSARKKALTNAGYDYAMVQKKVNEILSAKKSVDAIAKEVILGKWGNGSARKKALEKAGYNYSAVQKRVNELLATR